MKKFIISLEVRRPRNKFERGCYGVTQDYDNGIIDVYLNNCNKHIMAETFFHEITHAFHVIFKRRKRISAKHEEKLCCLIGSKVSEVLRRGR